ncbi:methyltransferase domain-containing protein [Streptomyces sp. HNM0574]|uniref:methyltransferase domain-containing protein n=1 Tax=Streptomyces sp. HNM0574 TaxID=2714954 RepID=UPI00146E9C96|nr:methyltransferase domain-containing protein [Streptomyces sp. HNM0574]
MTTSAWDPQQYLRHSTPRTRALRDLLARVPEPPGAPAPRVADLGCGPGEPSRHLVERWPAARVTGYDSSPAMLDEARAHAGPTTGGGSLDFAPADIADWRPATDSVDLIFSNAAFHWVPEHPRLFPAWIDALPPGGVLAFQVPGNDGAASHTLLDELRDSPRWRARLGTRHDEAPHRATVLDPAGYFATLAPLGCEVDTWETTYLHLLPGEDAVLEWTKGTTLRPVLTLLEDDPETREAFLADYLTALRTAYPTTPHGTPFPFRRIFTVARKRG